MTALDTNLLVRVITSDDPDQVEQARNVLRTTTCFVQDTVLLETGWVLETRYGLERSVVADSLRAFLGLDAVHTRHPERIEQALRWYEAGFDFADALHLALAPSEVDRFATFDAAFIQQAGDDETPTPVVQPSE